jgi:hypothetical protein
MYNFKIATQELQNKEVKRVSKTYRHHIKFYVNDKTLKEVYFKLLLKLNLIIKLVTFLLNKCDTCDSLSIFQQSNA